MVCSMFGTMIYHVPAGVEGLWLLIGRVSDCVARAVTDKREDHLLYASTLRIM
jgi:hypothetical protein